jgi:hypothetical protein
VLARRLSDRRHAPLPSYRIARTSRSVRSLCVRDATATQIVCDCIVDCGASRRIATVSLRHENHQTLPCAGHQHTIRVHKERPTHRVPDFPPVCAREFPNFQGSQPVPLRRRLASQQTHAQSSSSPCTSNSVPTSSRASLPRTSVRGARNQTSGSIFARTNTPSGFKRRPFADARSPDRSTPRRLERTQSRARFRSRTRAIG